MSSPLYLNYATHPLASVAANARALLEGFKKVFGDELKETKDVYTQIFDVQKSEKRSEVVTEWGGLTLATEAEDAGGTDFEDIFMGGVKETRHREFRKGYRITQQTLEDELYGISKKGMKELPRVFPRRVESYCAGIVSSSFTTLYGFDPVSTTIPLISASHNYAPGKYDLTAGSSVVTWSNLMAASAPSPSTIQAGYILMQKQRTRVGAPMDLEPSTILCNTNLVPVFWKIFNSMNQAFEFSNTKGIMGPQGPWKMKVIEWKWLATQKEWYMIDTKQSPYIFYWRIKPTFANDEDKLNWVHRYYGRMRFSADAYEPRGIVGSVGA